MRIFREMLVLLVVAMAAPAGADEAWRVDKDQDGIQVSTRAVEGWSMREIRGVMRADARLSSLVAVIVDVRVAHDLSDVIAEQRVLQRDSDTRYSLYSAMKLPWPVSNRDIVNQREIAQDPGNLAVTITDLAVENAPPRDGYVRMTRSRQKWTLTPAAGGGVQVETRVLSDPNGPIPAFIVNAMAVDGPFKTLSQLRALAQSPAYAGAALSYVKEPAAAP
jgi:START domain-containing protein